MKKRATCFTLLELLVVIAVIVILVAMLYPVLMDVIRRANNVKCMNNLKGIGIYIQQQAIKLNHYPLGGSEPGEWDTTFALMTGAFHDTRVGNCPGIKKNSPIDPRKTMLGWSTSSYAYVGSLSPTFVCQCSAWCKTSGKRIWALYWAGVDYGGVTTTHTRTGAPWPYSTIKTWKLADNLKWDATRVDTSESATQPTIPDNQDTDVFHGKDVVKYDTLSALRQIPETIEDHTANLPLVMDMVVIKPTVLPTNSTVGYIWYATSVSIPDETTKKTLLWANHCDTSAVSKKDWGINVYYTNGTVVWKDWKELRFQVMSQQTSVDGGKIHCYFY